MSEALASAARVTDGAARVEIDLPFRPPYDWPRLLRFLAGRAIPGVETVSDGAYLRAIEYRGAHGVLTVR